MPKIPVIQSELAPSFQRTGGGGVTPVSLDGLTRGAFDVLDTVERRKAQEARLAEQARQVAERQADDEARVSVSNTMSLAHADWAERLQSLQQSAPADAAGFTPSTMKEYDTWRDEAEKSVPERGRKLFRMQSDAFRTQIHGKALAFETQARQAKLVTDWDAGLDDDRRAVWADPSQFTDALARRQATAEMLGIPVAERDKLINKAVDALAYTAAMGQVRNDPADVLRRLGYGYSPPEKAQDSGDWQIPADVQAERDQERLRILEAEASDPQYDESTRAAVGREIALLKTTMGSRPPSKAPPLKTEKVDISKDPVFSNLPPEKLDTIANHALSMVRQQEAGLRAQQAASTAEGLKIARGVMSAWDNGYPQDPAVVSQAKNGVRGTPHEIDLLNAEARFGEAQRFRLMSPAQQQQYLAETRPQASTPEGAVLHEKLSNIHTSAVAEIKRDAFTYGARILNLQPATVDWSSPQAVAQTLPARVQQASVIAAKLGVEVSPITVQEAEAWGNHVEALPPQQRSQNIAEMTQVMGPQASVTLARTVGEKNKPLGLAIGLGSDGTTAGRYASELVLKGQQAIKDKTVKIEGGAEVGWRAQIVKEIGDAYPNEDVRRDMVEAAYLANIGMAAEGQGDPARAVRIITGGLTERGGAKVPLPRGVSSDDFDKAIRAATPANVLNAGPALPQNAPGLVDRGNIDLSKRPSVRNSDGSVSTVRSIGVNMDGREYLIPTVSDDGRVVSDAEAIANFRKTGRHLGVFASAKDSTAYAELLHQQQAGSFVYVRGQALPMADFLRALPDARLVHSGQGRYSVQAGGALVLNAQGQRVIVRFP